MNLRTALMMTLILFHAFPVWAVPSSADSCPAYVAKTTAMSSAAESVSQAMMQDANCCPGSGQYGMQDCETECRLQCAASVAFVIPLDTHAGNIPSLTLMPEARPGPPLPSHDISLLRPPRSLS